AVAHVLRQDAEMRVARRELGPGVADADHRAAVELVVRHAAVLHPAAIDEAVDVLAPEPLDAAALPGFFRRHYLIACTLSYSALSQGTSLPTRNGVKTFLNASRSDFTTVLPYLVAKSVASACSDFTISAFDFSAASWNTVSNTFLSASDALLQTWPPTIVSSISVIWPVRLMCDCTS